MRVKCAQKFLINHNTYQISFFNCIPVLRLSFDSHFLPSALILSSASQFWLSVLTLSFDSQFWILIYLGHALLLARISFWCCYWNTRKKQEFRAITFLCSKSKEIANYPHLFSSLDNQSSRSGLENFIKNSYLDTHFCGRVRCLPICEWKIPAH